jgi:predicted amidohydrolase
VIVALASPRVASTLEEGLEKVEWLVSEASARGADVVCFPEADLPGLRGQDFEVPSFGRSRQEKALSAAAKATGLLASRYAPERYREGDSE